MAEQSVRIRIAGHDSANIVHHTITIMHSFVGKTCSVQQGAHDATCSVYRPLSGIFTKESKAALGKSVRSEQGRCAWCNMFRDGDHVQGDR